MIAHSGGVVTVRAYRGSEVPGSSGIFRLQYKDKKKSVQWVHEAEKQPKSNAYSNIIEIIAAGNLFGSQCWDVSCEYWVKRVRTTVQSVLTAHSCYARDPTNARYRAISCHPTRKEVP